VPPDDPDTLDRWAREMDVRQQKESLPAYVPTCPTSDLDDPCWDPWRMPDGLWRLPLDLTMFFIPPPDRTFRVELEIDTPELRVFPAPIRNWPQLAGLPRELEGLPAGPLPARIVLDGEVIHAWNMDVPANVEPFGNMSVWKAIRPWRSLEGRIQPVAEGAPVEVAGWVDVLVAISMGLDGSSSNGILFTHPLQGPGAIGETQLPQGHWTVSLAVPIPADEDTFWVSDPQEFLVLEEDDLPIHLEVRRVDRSELPPPGGEEERPIPVPPRPADAGADTAEGGPDTAPPRGRSSSEGGCTAARGTSDPVWGLLLVLVVTLRRCAGAARFSPRRRR
jgi:hypothetical protein